MNKKNIRTLIFIASFLVATTGVLISQDGGAKRAGISPSKLLPGEKFLLIHHSSFVQHPQSPELAKGKYLTIVNNPLTNTEWLFSPVELPAGTYLKRLDLIGIDDYTGGNITLRIRHTDTAGNDGHDFLVQSGPGISGAVRTFYSNRKSIKMKSNRVYYLRLEFQQNTFPDSLKFLAARIVYQ